jgi:hypothetical protein
MVLGQHIAPEFGAEVAIDPAGQGGHDQLPFRRQPPLAAVAHHLGAQHEILHQEVLVAPEPRAGRHRGADHPLLDSDPRHHLAAAAATAAARRLRLGGLLHAARLDRWPTLQALEAGDLLTLRRHRPLELRYLPQQRANQRLQLGVGGGDKVGQWSGAMAALRAE